MRETVEARRRTIAVMEKAEMDTIASLCDAQTLDLIASFQYAVVGNLLRQTFAAAEAFGARGVVISGGVAANSELRRRFQAEADAGAAGDELADLREEMSMTRWATDAREREEFLTAFRAAMRAATRRQ